MLHKIYERTSRVFKEESFLSGRSEKCAQTPRWSGFWSIVFLFFQILVFQCFIHPFTINYLLIFHSFIPINVLWFVIYVQIETEASWNDSNFQPNLSKLKKMTPIISSNFNLLLKEFHRVCLGVALSSPGWFPVPRPDCLYTEHH